MEPLKSKVMEGLRVTWVNHYRLSPVSAEYDVKFIESQIRAAIVEFCEMAQVKEIFESSDNNGEFPVDPGYGDIDLYRRALAAFGYVNTVNYLLRLIREEQKRKCRECLDQTAKNIEARERERLGGKPK